MRAAAVSLALLYLGSGLVFGPGAAQLDIAADFKRKWTKWALSRARRDAPFPGIGKPLSAGQSTGPGGAEALALLRPQDVDGEPSRPDESPAVVRVKRYRQFPSHFQTPRLGCRIGTCTVQNLAHQIYQLTDKEKDVVAPAGKISARGYGRRRRRRALLAAAAEAAPSEESSSRRTRSLAPAQQQQPWHAPPHSAPFRRT